MREEGARLCAHGAVFFGKTVYRARFPCYNRTKGGGSASPARGTSPPVWRAMVCSVCKKNMATHRIENEGGEVFLCDDCFERLGAAAEYGADPGLFVSFMGIEGEAERRCPVCGTTLSRYSATGLVGCAHCYDVFRDELLPSIRRIHGRPVHVGKHPLGDGKFFELLEERKRLRSELERAVKENRMKDAERLNRDIREISKILHRGDFEGGEDE